MNPELPHFGVRLRESLISTPTFAGANPAIVPFSALALELFSLQYDANAAYRQICAAQGQTPATVKTWQQIPAVPTAVFKDLELTCLLPAARSAVFHSSGTTEQRPSRHFHSAESLAVYEASLWSWFAPNIIFPAGDAAFDLVCLTPPSPSVPHSSLVHMFEVVRQKLGASESAFVGSLGSDGAWTLNFEAALAKLTNGSKPKLVLGTAFSFVHLVDELAARQLPLRLPPSSRIMETGGYKNRSRTMPKAELHDLITQWLGVARPNIICEYGMSELSSQAYDTPTGTDGARAFHFPPWARVQIISPETGREVAEGETGLIRILDLANTFSVAAIQTEDLAIRWGTGFELLGRAQQAEPRGCSLMTA